MADRAVVAAPQIAKVWLWHGSAFARIGDVSTAARSFLSAARLFARGADEERRSECVENARSCLYATVERSGLTLDNLVS